MKVSPALFLKLVFNCTSVCFFFCKTAWMLPYSPKFLWLVNMT